MLEFLRPVQFLFRLALRYPGQIGLIPVGCVYRRPHCSGLDISKDIGPVLSHAHPLLARRKLLWDDRRISFHLGMRDEEGSGWLATPTRPRVRIIKKPEVGDRRRRVASVDHIHYKQIGKVSQAADHDHVRGSFDVNLRPGLEPASRLQSERSGRHYRRVDRNDRPRINRHTNPLLHVPALHMASRGVAINFGPKRGDRRGELRARFTIKKIERIGHVDHSH
jgi:hypothetical protein